MWRGGDVKNMKQEFGTYGLPNWSMYFVGLLKISFLVSLLLGIYYFFLIEPATYTIALSIFFAIIMHVKINDPLYKSTPAFLFLILSLFIIFYKLQYYV